MASYERETVVKAPLDRVWEFHSSVEGLEALTPDFMHLEVQSVVGPDGEPDPEVLEAGSRVHVNTRPFGVGPGQAWTSVIVERRGDAESAMFRDVMEDGPFDRWEHTHRFLAEGEGTRVVDHVEYQLPGGGVGRVLSPLGWLGLEPMFRERHRRTRKLLGG